MDYKKREKSVRARIKEEEFETDEEGRVVVRINITDGDYLLSVYNDDGMKIISAETAKFIDDVTKPIPAKQDIHLKISCDDYTTDKEQEYKNAITNYYTNEFAYWDIKLKHNLQLALVLFLVSCVCFTLLYFMSTWHTHEILYLLFEVASWVFAWEAVDIFFLQRFQMNYNKHKAMQIIYARISFIRLKDMN